MRWTANELIYVHILFKCDIISTCYFCFVISETTKSRNGPCLASREVGELLELHVLTRKYESGAINELEHRGILRQLLDITNCMV